jgi:hypothetical protein
MANTARWIPSPCGAGVSVQRRSADIPVCGFWGLSSPQFVTAETAAELESSANPQAGKPALPAAEALNPYRAGQGEGGEIRDRFQAMLSRLSPLPGPLPARSSRGEGEVEAPSAPRAFVAYPADSCVMGLRDVATWKYGLKRWDFRVILQCHERLGIEC